MKNEDYLELKHNARLTDKVTALCKSIENMCNAEYKGAEAKNLDVRKYYAGEYLAMVERVNYLYKDVIEDIEKLTERIQNLDQGLAGA